MTSPAESRSVTALVAAGRRPGADPLATHFGVDDKALIPIDGEPMLSRVARTLSEHPAIGRIIVLAQDPARLIAGVPWMAANASIIAQPGGMSVSDAVARAIEAFPSDFPFLLTTADNVLLDRAMLNAFISEASGHDLAVAVVDRKTLLSSYPASKRTWLRFRGGAYSGANLFWLGSPRVATALGLWQTIEQKRKRGRAVIRAFGPLMLMATALRLLSLGQAIHRAGRRLGLDARAVILPFAEACIDVDTVEDHALATQIIGARR